MKANMYGNFKAYPGDSRYEVSDQGWVRNVNTGNITKGHKNYKGYNVFGLTRYKVVRVSNMVLETFVGPRPEGYQCDHINTVRDDDRLENLRWVSPTGNNLNPITRKKRWVTKKGRIYVYVIGVRMVKITETMQEMANFLGVKYYDVSNRVRFQIIDKQGGIIIKVNTIK